MESYSKKQLGEEIFRCVCIINGQIICDCGRHIDEQTVKPTIFKKIINRKIICQDGSLFETFDDNHLDCMCKKIDISHILRCLRLKLWPWINLDKSDEAIIKYVKCFMCHSFYKKQYVKDYLGIIRYRSLDENPILILNAQ